MEYWFLLLCALCGSIPFGLLIGFLAGKDVRKEGSGNIGFTNVLRVCGKAWGIPVLLLDAAKGFVPVFFVSGFFLADAGESAGLFKALGGICAVLGHNYSPWLKFKGGKGVATGSAVLAALVPYPFLIGFGVWIALVLLFRYVSLGSMCGAFVVLVVQVVFTRHELFSLQTLPATLMCLAIYTLVMVSHRSNIGRLLRGEENKLGRKKETPSAQ